MPSVTHVFVRSKDRDSLYSSPSSYRIQLPRKLDNVSKIQVSSLELPSNNTHMTIEEDVNDRFWFSEGLKIDLGEGTDSGAGPTTLKSDVDGISGLDLANNHICIREDTTAFTVAVPAYLCPILSVNGGTGALTILDSIDSYACYEAWRTSTSLENVPQLQIVCPHTGYSEIFDGSAVTVPGDSALFANSFVYCPPLSVEEICSYLTYCYRNFTTYFGASMPTNQYTFEYIRGRVQVHKTGSVSATKLHFPTTGNATTTLFYGTQYPNFTTRNSLNSSGGTITSLGYMLGFNSNTRSTTWTLRAQNSTRTFTGFRSVQEPRFLFEARLLPGIYSQQTLSTSIPIAMNPLYFPQTSSVPGFCYFGFRDSLGIEKLAIIHSGQYTVESLCRSLSYLLTRLDSRGLFHSQDRFAYLGTPLDGMSVDRPALDFGVKVVYNVRYNFTTSKFTIESAFTSAAQVNDPSGNTITVDTDRPAPTFDLLFQPSSLSKIAAQVTDLSTLCTSSNVDRITNVLGFEIQDYLNKSAFTSTKASYIPRIPCTLSQGGYFTVSRPRTFGYLGPDELGLGTSTSYGAGLPTYFYPSGQYAMVGNSPTTQSLNLTTQTNSGLSLSEVNEEYASKKGSHASNPLRVTITNDGQISGDYTIATAGTAYSTQIFVVGDSTYTSPQRPASTIFQVTDVSYASGTAVNALTLVTPGTGMTAASDVSFNEIVSYGILRKGACNSSTTDTTCTFSGHSQYQSSTNLAMSTSRPFGFQVGDLTQIRCVDDSTLVVTASITATMTVTATTSQRGVSSATTYAHAGVSPLIAGNYHILRGGNYDCVLEVTTSGGAGVAVLTVVENGSGYYAGDTYPLSRPIRYEPFTGIVTQICNSGGQFVDVDNSNNEHFYASLPLLPHSQSMVAGRYCDGATIRMRVPSNLRHGGFGHAQSVHTLSPVRTDFHMEDWDRGIRQYSAHDTIGLGEQYLSITQNPEFPHDMDVAPVPYLLLCIKNLTPYTQTQMIGNHVDSLPSQDVVGKVVIGAPIAINKTSPLSLELNRANISFVDVEFRLPNNQQLYNFHGLEHALTLSFQQETDRSY